MKTCSKCGVDKPSTLEHFGPDKRKRNGLTAACRHCHRARCLAYRAANLDKVRECAREWARKSYAANPEHHRALVRKCVAAHPERVRAYRAANLERDRECVRRWGVANREKRHASWTKRRAVKRAALDPSASQIAMIAIHAESRMAAAFMGSPFAVDHIVPLARGGKHHEDNLRSLPARLNGVKGSKLDSEVTDSDFKVWTHPSPTFERVIPRGCLPCILAVCGGG